MDEIIKHIKDTIERYKPIKELKKRIKQLKRNLKALENYKGFPKLLQAFKEKEGDNNQDDDVFVQYFTSLLEFKDLDIIEAGIFKARDCLVKGREELKEKRSHLEEK